MRWLKNNIIALLNLIPVAGAAIIVFLGWLQHAPWYLIALAAIFAIAFIFWAINQIETRQERHKKKLSQLSDKELEDTIHKWIKKPYLKTQPIERDEIIWGFTVEGAPLYLLEVVKLKTEQFQLRLGVTIPIDEKVTEFLFALPEPKRTNIIADIALELIRFGVGFAGLEHPFKTLAILYTIPIDDGLTEFYFLQRIQFVFRAMALVYGYMDRLLRENVWSPLNLPSP